MLISVLLAKTKAGTLTCAEVVQLLDDQPTADETSHPHMHTRDGFPVAAKEWQELEYAHTTLASRTTTVPVYDPAKGQKPPGVHGKLSLDASRTALPARPGMSHSKYDLRSGLPEVPEVPEQGTLEPVYKIIQPKGKPLEVSAAPQHGNVNVSGPKPLLPDIKKHETIEPVPTGDTRNYATTGGGGTRTVYFKYSQLAPKVPKIPGTEEHTMFEDSESMVMHLTAALLSTCGQNVLETLKTRGPGSPLTVGLFTRSAVHAVKSHIASAKTTVKTDPQTLVRTAEVTNAPRTPSSPNPLTGTFKHATKGIDHIVVVLGLRASGDVNVVTCYPSPVPTMATIKTSNAPDLDIEEHEIGKHRTETAQKGTEIKLTW